MLFVLTSDPFSPPTLCQFCEASHDSEHDALVCCATWKEGVEKTLASFDRWPLFGTFHAATVRVAGWTEDETGETPNVEIVTSCGITQIEHALPPTELALPKCRFCAGGEE